MPPTPALPVKNELRILVLEDSPADVTLIDRELRRAGFRSATKRVETRDAFAHELKVLPPDVILSDHGLPAFDGFAALELARRQCPEIPFIFVTGSMGEELAITSLRSGATDYVLKSRLSKLGPAIERALRLVGEGTQRRRAEGELRASEERYRLLATGVTDYALCQLDADGRIASWNAGAERLLGHRRETLVDRRFHQLFPTEEVARRKPDQILAVATAEGHYEGEPTLLRQDGVPFPANLAITALHDHTGLLTGFSVLVRDLSPHGEPTKRLRDRVVALEHQVREQAAEIQSVHAEQESFVHSVTHDLRAPLTHIVGFVGLLQGDSESSPDPTRQRHLDTIARAADHLSRMLSELLAWSQLGRAELHRTRVHLGELVRELQRELTSQLPDRTITWVVGELPEVEADPTMLRQVLLNLLANALKFTRPRTDARIEIGMQAGAAEPTIFVRDNGIGFDPRYAGRLFGVFQRMHSSTEFEGTGTGLAAARRIVERHGGRIWAESTPDAGATFWFTLLPSAESEKSSR